MPDREIVSSKEKLEPLFNHAKGYFKRKGSLPVFTDPEYPNLKVINVGGKLFVIDETRCLGQGSFGAVYVGQNEQGDCFALKVEALDPTEYKPIIAEKLKVREILEKTWKYQASAKVETKEALTFRGKDTPTGRQDLQGNHFYFTVTTLERGDQLLKEIPSGSSKSLDQKTAYTHALKAAFDLYFLHSLGIIHRDLKPENYMSEAKTVDLSVAKQSPFRGKQIATTSIDYDFAIVLPKGEDTVIDVPKGTPGYVAPEIMDKGEYSFASDVYALGVLFLGNDYKGNPFRAGAINIADPRKRNPWLDNLNLPLTIFADMLSIDPQKRPSTLEIIGRLVTELKKEKDLDEVANQMILMYENYLKGKGKLTEPLFKDFQIDYILDEFENGHHRSKDEFKTILEIMKSSHLNNDQKMVALKGYLFGSEPDSPLIHQINRISGKARFIDDKECENFYKDLKSRFEAKSELENRSTAMGTIALDFQALLETLDGFDLRVVAIKKILEDQKYNSSMKCMAIRGFLLQKIEGMEDSARKGLVPFLERTAAQFPLIEDKTCIKFYNELPEMKLLLKANIRGAEELSKKLDQKIKEVERSLKPLRMITSFGAGSELQNKVLKKEYLELLRELKTAISHLDLIKNNDPRVYQLLSIEQDLEAAKRSKNPAVQFKDVRKELLAYREVQSSMVGPDKPKSQ